MLGVKKTTEEFVAEAQSVHGDKFDIAKTEVENMSNAGYIRAFDCGNYVYEWKNLTIV